MLKIRTCLLTQIWQRHHYHDKKTVLRQWPDTVITLVVGRLQFWQEYDLVRALKTKTKEKKKTDIKSKLEGTFCRIKWEKSWIENGRGCNCYSVHAWLFTIPCSTYWWRIRLMSWMDMNSRLKIWHMSSYNKLSLQTCWVDVRFQLHAVPVKCLFMQKD